MNFGEYLKDKLSYIIATIFVIISSEILLLPFEVQTFAKLYIGLIPIIMLILCLLIEFYKKQNYYNTLKQRIAELDKKYLITEVVNNPDFVEGRILNEMLQETGKSMLENVNTYKYLQEEYKEYVELWIHEIKLPISTGKLIIENNKTEVTESINEELDKIDNYVEQALFYARSQAPEKDYMVKKQELQEIVNSAILKNKRALLQSKIKLNIHDLQNEVFTDSKWCIFIINQIIQNSIKYSKEENSEIEIFSQENKDNVILFIKDNGIGIRQTDIGRIFEKGFTGENGRRNGQKATGIGLYLCEKLCNKLGLKIEIKSKEDIGTEVRFVFPKSSYINMG